MPPHSVRHSAAAHLSQTGVVISVIAPWLGHERRATAHRGLKAELAMTEKAQSGTAGPRYRRTPLQGS
jgi:integrase